MLIDVSAKSLKTRLGGDDQQLLERVALLWGVDLAKQDRTTTLSLLMGRMRDPFWARGVWMEIEADEQVCLFETLAAGGDRSKGVPLDRLRKRTKLAPDVFEVVIARLVARGLLEEGEIARKPSPRTVEILQPACVQAVCAYRECAEALYTTGQELFIPAFDRSARSLERLIGSRTGEQLRHLAYLCHVPRRQLEQIRLPHELERVVGEALSRPLVVFDLLHRLDGEAQELFLWLYQQGGKVPILEVYRTFGREPERLHALFSQLESYALAFDGLAQTDERVVFIPEAILGALKDEAKHYLADERAHALFPVSFEPTMRREAQPLLCYDLATIIGSVLQGCIEPTKEGALPKRFVAKVRPLLQGLRRLGEGQTDLYVDMLFGAAQGMDILRCAAPFGEEKPRYQAGASLTQWSQHSTQGQVRRFLQWWVKSSVWHDVHPSGKLVYPSAYNAPAARQALLKHLRQCLPEQYYRFDALLYAIWRQQPLIPFEGSFGTPSTGRRTSIGSRREQWMLSYAALYSALLCSTLYECGMISLGFVQESGADRDEAPDLFMLTELGAAALADAAGKDVPSSAGEANQGPLILQPNGDLIVQSPYQWSTLYYLLQFAQVVHVGPVSTFRLAQPALLRGLEAGLSVEDILAFLTKHCRHGIPQNVAYTLRWDWPKGYHVAGLTEVILVESSDEEGGQALKPALATLGCDVRNLAPCLFAITPNGRSFLEIKRALERAHLVVRGQPSLSVRRW